MCGGYTGEFDMEDVCEMILSGEIDYDDMELIEDVEACGVRGDAGYSVVKYEGVQYKLYYDWGETLCEVEVV